MSLWHSSRALLAAAALATAPLGAQERAERHHGFDSAEGRLLGFYSASLLFTPLAVVAPGGPSRLAFGVEVGWVPPLSEAQRTGGGDKPQNSNLAPVFPRPRVAVGLPGGATLEASWLPPVKVFDVKANLVNAAISAPLGSVVGLGLRGRVSAPWGYVQGAITCSADVAADGGADLELFYDVVCNGRDSEDRFEPRHVAAELVATGLRARALAGGTWVPWAAVGARREWTRFDVGVIREDGTREPDHPVLVLHGTRPHASIGASWTAQRGPTLAFETLYAPGSVLTARLYAGVRR